MKRLTPAECEALRGALHAGDVAATNRIAGSLRPRVYRFYRNQGIGHEDAEDLTQEVLLRLVRAAHRHYDPRRSLTTYVFTIARNTLRNHWRNGMRRRRIVSDEPMIDEEGFPLVVVDTRPLPDRRAEFAEFRTALDAAMEEVAPYHRDTVRLTLIEDRPYEEVAAATGKEVGTIKSGRSRGIAQLRAAMAAHDPVELIYG